ncbi:Leucyl aminopeptidase yscIV [Balamuthia mandrillaris]
MDPHSQANIDQVKVLHLDLTLHVDFEKKVMAGSALYRFLVVAEQPVEHVTLDTRDLTIHRAVEEGSGKELTFELGEVHPAFGAALRIQLAEPKNKGTEFQLRVYYETTPQSSGLQWLPPSQTEGKKHPYLFTQFQAIHARSGVPCQDTPAIKMTYSGHLTVPQPLVALMSAISQGSDELPDSKSTTYHFEQPVAIPSYLLAWVVGDLVSREIGPRSKVWSEREKVDAGAYEFAETEDYLKTAEELLTPYEWGRYDILLLPGSFPYGGMENPCLTFVTPTLLAGDRSLSSVVAHEISHSWMGNLVGCHSWEHFWLNEGFTVFVERKIIGRMFGEKQRHFSAIIGWKSLKDSVDHYGTEHQQFTTLIQDLKDIDPDDAFSSVPYERGFQFLFFLEQTVGGAEVFEPFFRAYVKEFSGKTVVSEEFKLFFLNYFQNLKDFDQDKLKQIDWDAWFCQPGMPPVDLLPMFDATLADASNALAKKWASATTAEEAKDVSSDDMKGWSSNQIVMFLEKLQLGGKPLPHDVLNRMDELYNLTPSTNSEIRFNWYQLCLSAGLDRIYPLVVSFVTEQGRMKFVRPLYRSLAKAPGGEELAHSTFLKHRSFYHNIAAKMVARDLGL